jgi:hypothetical protein
LAAAESGFADAAVNQTVVLAADGVGVDGRAYGCLSTPVLALSDRGQQTGRHTGEFRRFVDPVAPGARTIKAKARVRDDRPDVRAA